MLLPFLVDLFEISDKDWVIPIVNIYLFILSLLFGFVLMI